MKSDNLTREQALAELTDNELVNLLPWYRRWLVGYWWRRSFRFRVGFDRAHVDAHGWSHSANVGTGAIRLGIDWRVFAVRGHHVIAIGGTWSGADAIRPSRKTQTQPNELW